MKNDLKKILRQKGRIKKIGVMGMGYVGIPAAALFAASPDFDFVWGFQRNSHTSGYKIDMLNRGVCPINGKEPGLKELIRDVVAAGKFISTSDMEQISQVDALTIAVETAFRNVETLDPDYDSLIECLELAGKYMTPGTLIVIESTITPGTTSGFAREILEDVSGMKAGVDFALAHAPERVMPGRLLQNIREYDRVVGGIDQASTNRAAELYRPVLTKGKLILLEATAAEVSKTAENAFRDLQIAAANELSLYCESLGINFFDVKNAIASLKEEGVTRAMLNPGAGVGGHCLPKDTYHLLRALSGVKDKLSFPENIGSLFRSARGINDFMPRHMYHLTKTALESIDKPVAKSKVAILGWAYNQNTDDPRNTPSRPYRNLLLQSGAVVKVHDPFVQNSQVEYVKQDLDLVISGADVIAILTAHDEYRRLDLSRIKRLTLKSLPILIDGRNVIDPDEAAKTGFIFQGIGRGDKNFFSGE